VERDDDLMSGYNVHQYIDTNTLVVRFTSISRYIGLYTSHVQVYVDQAVYRTIYFSRAISGIRSFLSPSNNDKSAHAHLLMDS